MSYENNKYISILQSVKPDTRSAQFYLLSGFILGVLSVVLILLGYSYYQHPKGQPTVHVLEKSHQIEGLSATEPAMHLAGTPSDQENSHNPEDGFDQNIENMFKVTKPAKILESEKRTSPFDLAFDTQKNQAPVPLHDSSKLVKSKNQIISSSAEASRQTQKNEKKPVNINIVNQPIAPTAQPVEPKPVNTSSEPPQESLGTVQT